MEIKEINIPSIELSEPLHIAPPIVVDIPITIDMGFPVIDAPCAVVRDSVTGGKDHFTNDPDGNVALCDHTAPFYFAPDFTPNTKIITPKQNTKTETLELTKVKSPNIPKPKENNNDITKQIEEIDCPAKNQQYRIGDLRNSEAKEKVVGFEIINGQCVELWASTNIVDKYLPSGSVAATTFGVTIVATTAATLTPFLNKALKPVFKQIISRLKKLIGKKDKIIFSSKVRLKKQKLLSSKNVDD